jgi:hypothetical protein
VKAYVITVCGGGEPEIKAVCLTPEAAQREIDRLKQNGASSCCGGPGIEEFEITE